MGLDCSSLRGQVSVGLNGIQRVLTGLSGLDICRTGSSGCTLGSVGLD